MLIHQIKALVYGLLGQWIYSQ